MLQNKTWLLTCLLVGQKAIKCKWVYWIKTNAQGKIYKCKVRVVTKGFFQTFSIDYNDIFSLVIKYDSIWSVLVIVVTKDFDIIQFDIKISFFYVDLNEDIYTCQPEGLVVPRSENKVCLFHKSPYGLKQAKREE